MKLDIGSLMFNMSINSGGGTPSWGTALGQNVNYKFSAPGIEELLTSMVYCAVDTSLVYCPLGKGGQQQDNYEFVLASLYDKVYANGILIPNAKFILLIIKKLVGEYHVGRRTLKYNSNMMYNNKPINSDCFTKMAEVLGISENGAWFVYSISTKNQDELHFDVIIANPNTFMSFNTVEERKEYINKLFKENNVNFEEHNLLGNILEDIRENFKNWLLNQKTINSEVTAANYVRYIDYLKEKNYTDYDLYSVNDLSIIEDLLQKFKKDEAFIEYNQKNNRAPYNALYHYNLFLKSLNSDEIIKDLKSYYIENLNNNSFIEEQIKNREEFINEYPLERLLNLTKEEYCLGLDSQETFSYKLEFGKYKDTAFGIGGGTSGKHGIYYSKDEQHYKGKNNEVISNPDLYFEQFKNQLVSFLKYVGENNPDFDLNEKFPLLGGSGNYMVLTKLLCLYYPNRFIGMSKQDIYDKLGDYFDTKYKSNTLLNSYYANLDFRKNIPEANNNDGFYISNAIWKYFYEYLVNKEQLKENAKPSLDFYNFNLSPIHDGINLIVYGTPGCGKSYYVSNEILKDYDKDNIIRTTFYQDYTNTDFIGQILPEVKEKIVTYEFNPGPFTLALEKAIQTPNDKVALVIEELNRGNAASIFGDIFQLLDRGESAVSEYGIKNVNIINYLNKKFENIYVFDEIKIPSNLSIYATMNTSDQNVFTLDTAFKRRWKFKKLVNKFDYVDEDGIHHKHDYSNFYIPKLNEDIDSYTWQEVVEAINNYILTFNDYLSSEDKQIGIYFISKELLEEHDTNISTKKKVREFSYKLLEYLWDDVAKFNREDWFDNKIKSLDKLIEAYDKEGIKVLKNVEFEKDRQS